MTSVEARVFSPRESVQVALTSITPGDASAVSSVAELPAPEMVPATDVQAETIAGTPSGLAQGADKFAVPPAGTLIGVAVIDTAGGCFGGSGFTMKSAEQIASLFFFSLASVTGTETVSSPGAAFVVPTCTVASFPMTLPPRMPGVQR